MTITVHDDPTTYLEVARGPLLEREAANGLLLGVALRLAVARDPSQPAPYMATVADDSGLLLAALMTPPHSMLLFSPERAAYSRAISVVCDELHESGTSVPGVLAPTELAAAFASSWTEQPRISQSILARQWVYKLRQVEWSAVTAPGCYRWAEESDLDALANWFGEGSRQGLRHKVNAREIGLWTNPHPVSVAGTTRFTGTGGAINRVYTPAEERNRGYSTACVATLCQRLLDGGWRFCCLHADQANEPANRVYRKVGFVPVCAYAEYRFPDAISGGSG